MGPNAHQFRILYVSPKYPALNQPWIVDTVARIFERGHHVSFAALEDLRNEYAQKADPAKVLHNVAFPSFSRRKIAERLVTRLGNAITGRDDHLLADVTALLKPSGDFAGGLKSRLRTLSVGHLPVASSGMDIIHAHGFVPAFDFMRVARLRKVPFVMSYHGLVPWAIRSLGSGRVGQLFDGADAVLANTQFAAAELAQLGCERSKIHILPQGIDLRSYRCQREHDNGGDQPLRLLTIGRFEIEKGHSHALQAARILADRGLDFRYTLVGSGSLQTQLEQQVEALGLGQWVSLRSTVPEDEKRKLLRSNDIFIFPSIVADGRHVETQGVAIQEAQASGCIVVASAVGGIVECIDHGLNGYLVEACQPEAIADQVEALVGQRQKWPAIRQAASAHVRDHYDVDHIIDQLIGIYSRCHGRRA